MKELNRKPSGGIRAARRPAAVGGALLALIAPMMVPAMAQADPAPTAEAVTISKAGAFTQVVPDGVCAVRVTVAGAPGGVAIAAGDAEPDPENPGELRGANGAGGVVSALLRANAGESLSGVVGSAGGNGGAAGAPGGGTGGRGGHPGGGGGGYTSLTLGSDLLLLAAGGGGTGGGHTGDHGHGGDGGFDLSASASVPGGTVFAGGDGTEGRDLGWNQTPVKHPGAGLGGGTSGGTRGQNSQSNTDPAVPGGFDWNGFAGSAMQGGNGGADFGADTGGAGGAGYFGGGGGAATNGDVGSGGQYFVGGGGGGGASFAAESIDAATLDLGKNRAGADAANPGSALPAYAKFEWVMCDYNLAISKSVVGAPVFEDGATVRYSVTVKNTGDEDMAIGDTVTVLDDLAVGGTIVSVTGLGTSVPAVGGTVTAAGIEAYDLVGDGDAQRPRGLAAGDSVTIVYDVVVSGTEPVKNTATTGDRVDGDDDDAASVTIDPARPSLSLTKSADTPKITSVGQQVTYSFVVKNTGNIEIRDVKIAEGEFSGAGELPAPTCPVSTLQPGETETCTSVYRAVAADLTGDDLTNTATAGGRTPLGADVTSDESAAKVLTVKPVPPATPTPSPEAPKLATTGGENLAGWAAAAAVLIALGAASTAVARRRRV